MQSVPLEAASGSRYYRLTAFVICHDLRCNLPIEALVALPRAPTGGEAVELLRPTVEERLIQHSGESGYRYELLGVKVAATEQ